MGRRIYHLQGTRDGDAVMLIGLVGTRQSGKDTVARYLKVKYGFTPVKLAASLKGFLFVTGQDVLAWLPEMSTETRRQLQQLGDKGRSCHQDLFVDFLFALAPDSRIVISDVRYPNEATAIKSKGGILVRLVRPISAKPSIVDFHPSEREADTIKPDFYLFNSGSLADLLSSVDVLLTQQLGIEPKPRAPRLYLSSNISDTKEAEDRLAYFAQVAQEHGFDPLNPLDYSDYSTYFDTLFRQDKTALDANKEIFLSNCHLLQNADCLLVLPYSPSFGIGGEVALAALLGLPIVVTAALDTPFPANPQTLLHPWLITLSNGHLYGTLSQALTALKTLFDPSCRIADTKGS